MPLEPGRTVSHYRIIAAIGAGGMGEVYRATDTRLGRDVALKLLPAQVTEDPERLARFRREAQLLASLNHPNIAAIYGLEEAAGKPFLSLELVEGEDLAGRLARGPLPLQDAMDVARQIAEGLEEAHEKGIVHRDLKPANLKVTPEGKVKILDFGLAKACEGSGAEHESAGALSQSPTLTRLAGTEIGVILGTAAYMSPEQARGKSVERRADVWAFGVVLYEMLTGKTLFGGETVSDVIAAVLTRNADLSVLPKDAPPALRRLLLRCLERDPKRRLRDIGEARFTLQEILSGTPEGDVPEERERARQGQGSRSAWRAAADQDPAGNQDLPLDVAAGTIVYTTSETQPESPLAWVASGRSPDLLPFPARRYAGLDLSPDGRTVAAASLEAGRYQIRLLDLQRGMEQPLDLPGSNWSPHWDPRGDSIAFRSMRKGDFDVYRVEVRGSGREEPVSVVNLDEIPHAWSPDGRQLIILRTEPDGSDSIRAITIGEEAEPRLVGHGWFLAADVSRDGRWLAYASTHSGRSEIYVQPFPGPGPAVRISLEGGRAPRWSKHGTELFFARDDHVIALSFRIEGGRFVPGGESVVLEAPMMAQDDPLSSPDDRRFLVRLRIGDPEPPRLRVVLNWNREVERMAPRP